MTDELINQLCMQVARLENRIDALEATQGEEQGDSFDDLYLRMETGGGGGEPQGAFRLEGDKITHCNFYAAHQVIELDDVTIGEGGADGTWYLNVDHNDLGAATVSTQAGANDDDHTAIPLFTIEDGKITKDCRGMPFVPIYA